ncbi:MAG: hypothetical protein S4CHLAM37_14030 [Chlamydiia bacterium]|nr:hypothetical protein [Chlamydiia bacterium]
MSELREQISKTNSCLIDLLKERSELTKKIAIIKDRNNLPIYDPKREELLIDNIRELALKKKVDPQLAEFVIRIILSFSKGEMRNAIEHSKTRYSS